MWCKLYNELMPVNVGFDNLLDNLSTAILVTDEMLHIRYANNAAENMLQLSSKQMCAELLEVFFLHDSLDFQRLEETLKNGDGFSDSEVHLVLADGRFIMADLTVTCIDFNNQRSLLLEFKKVDQQKRISQESMQWAQQQAARDLIRGLAHEIKNPLGGIRGAAQLLDKQLNNPETSEFTQMIIEQSDRLRNLVDRLLGPNIPPSFKWQNIHQVLEKVRTLVSFDESTNVIVNRDYDPSIPDMLIDGDMIQQAVLNIVRNSMQALDGMNHQGEINLVTRIGRQMTIHGVRYPLVAKVKVIDNGPGIPTHLKDTLFYPMVTGKKNGTGLGLSIAQTLIDHHRGKIDVDSWPGHTEFTLYLPIDKKEPT